MARAARKDPTVRELDERLNKVEGGFERLERKIDVAIERFDRKIDAAVERLDRNIDEAQHSNDLMFKVLLRQREDDRVLADRRHAEIMAQFEKLQAKSTEN
jgi:hypothetical protein